MFHFKDGLGKKQKKLWSKSKEHLFFEEIFAQIDEHMFAKLYSKKLSRPNVPINQLVGSLILKHLNDWTYEELFTNLNFNLLTRHAIGIDSLNTEVFCEASIFNFQNRVIDHYKTEGTDLIEVTFSKLTESQLERFGVDTSVQRGDSFLVGSNIMDYTRLGLLIEVIIRVHRILSDEDTAELKDDLSPYVTYTSNNYIYRVKKEDLPTEMQQLGDLFAKLHVALGDRYRDTEEYQNFVRALEEHFDWQDVTKKIEVTAGKDLHSGILMSPDDTEATYRDKGSQKCKGYVTHLSETVNPENKVNLITDVVVLPNNIGDAEILEKRLPLMLEQTPDLAEYFVDGLYGSPAGDLIAEEAGVILYQKTIRGQKSKGGIRIALDEALRPWVTCKGGQRVKAEPTKGKRMKAEFDISICDQCPFRSECNVREFGGKQTTRKRVYYFGEKEILSHKRMTNIDNLSEEKRHSRANVEATVKEAKRGMRNGKVRVRGRIRVSFHMMFTAIGINFTRIWAKRPSFDQKPTVIHHLIPYPVSQKNLRIA